MSIFCVSGSLPDTNPRLVLGYNPKIQKNIMLRTQIIVILLSLLVACPVHADIHSDLLDAVRKGDTVTIKTLLANVADINAGDKNTGTTLLMAAIAKGHVETVQILLAKGANPELKGTGFTPLWFAVVKGNVDIVQELVTKGVDINAKDDGGVNILSVAAKQGHFEIVELLKKAGAIEDEFFLPSKFFGQGSNHLSKNEYDAATKAFTSALSNKPNYLDCIEVYNSRGWAYLQKGNYDKAIEDFNKIITLASAYAELMGTYEYRGRAFFNKGQMERAIEDFQKDVEKNPKNVTAYHLMGRAFLDLKQYDKVIETCASVFAIDSNNVNAFYYRGLSYNNTGQFDRAIADYKKAIELEYNSVGIHEALGKAYYNMKQYDKAIEPLKKAIQLKPDFADAFLVLGACYYEKKLNTIAADYFYKAGLLFIKQGERERALMAYNGVKYTNGKQLEQKLFAKLYPEGNENLEEQLSANAKNKSFEALVFDKIPASFQGHNEKVKIVGEYRYTYGDGESLVDAKKTCYSMAVRNAVESCKIFVAAISTVQNYQLTEDIIKTISTGYVKDLKTVEETVTGRTVYTKVEGYIFPEAAYKMLRQHE